MQWGNVGGLIGLYTQDYDLIGRFPDEIGVDYLRSHADTWFWSKSKKTLENSALGLSIEI
jgi:hypothetical protein